MDVQQLDCGPRPVKGLAAPRLRTGAWSRESIVILPVMSIYALQSPIRLQNPNPAQPCDLCSSSYMHNFLRTVIDDRTFDGDHQNKGFWPWKGQSINLGSWSELLRRAISCEFCRAITSLLQEVVEEQTTGDENSTVEKIDCCMERARR